MVAKPLVSFPVPVCRARARIMGTPIYKHRCSANSPFDAPLLRFCVVGRLLVVFPVPFCAARVYAMGCAGLIFISQMIL